MGAIQEHSCLELFSWSVDIEWSSGILLSICNRNSGGFIPTINNNDLDWSALTESLGLVYHISTPCNVSSLPFNFSTVRLSGVLILLGVSTYWCYRCLKSLNRDEFIRIRSCSQSSNCNILSPDDLETPSSSPPSPKELGNQTISRWSPLGGVDSYLQLQTKYFGPSNPDQGDEDPTPKVHSDDNLKRCERNRRKLRRYSATLDGGETSTDTSSSTSSLFSHSHIPNNNFLVRDLSFDSLGFSSGKYCDDSIDSASSEISLDFVSNFEQPSDNSTVARLDKLQEEIDQLKSNCLLMDEDFGIIKCNRNLPGLSNLMETNELQGSSLTSEDIVKQQNAKACFKGLYSLTTINRSMSLEFSDPLPIQHNSHENSQVLMKQDEGSSFIEDNTKFSSIVGDDQLPSLEWDEEEMNDFAGESEESLINQKSNIIPFTPDRSESCESALNMTKTWSMCSSMSISDIETQLSNNDSFYDNEVENIGPRHDLLLYAQNEWNKNTAKAQTILQGYKELSSLNCKYLRRIRADNYSIMRSVIFQVITQGIPVRSSEQVLHILYKAMDSGIQSLLNWKFSNHLPYGKSNVRKGMEICLQTLDNVASMMASNSKTLLEREDSMCRLLNADPTLDIYILEAVKLHMMVEALDFHLGNGKGQNVDKSLFYRLMTDREIPTEKSETQTDFMNNLHQNSNNYCLEQLELFLLGYALSVTLKVVRPSAFGTDGFVSFYPDTNASVWPQVLILAEDDRHYSILI